MSKEYITAYITSIYWDDSSQRWNGGISIYRPTSGEYYAVKVPVPSKILENKKGEIIAEEE